jgi:hypothetical protein
MTSYGLSTVTGIAIRPSGLIAESFVPVVFEDKQGRPRHDGVDRQPEDCPPQDRQGMIEGSGGVRRPFEVRRGVNYFGHAAVASWSAPAEPGVILGAMLPDFAGMCGARIAAADEAPVAGGIALHHATDAAFHPLPAVTGLMRELDEQLASAGCARGPRRAVSHIGVELLLDGVLVDEPRYRAAYLAGLAHRPALRWRDPDGGLRFAALLDRLRARGVPDDLRRPEAIATRVHRVLAHRPLLAPSPGELGAIRDALAALQPRIAVAAETIVRALRAALAAPEDPPPDARPPPGQA